ncbi:MAG TPA: 2OG-Fe(II) oxygenase [Rhodanobacter sp.]|nr:2OG-Fe(II) oxygenase [Rhodanobacter sp.]
MLSSTALEQRLRACDWTAVTDELDAQGHARLPSLLPPATCRELATLYQDDAVFRSRVTMERHGFGRGEYRYFAYPLPALVETLRRAAWPHLAPLANRWNEALDLATRYPASHADYLAQCHAAGQRRPTPLLLQYGAGDYNCLHQDIYGEHVFPLQLAVLLSAPGEDFDGGEFVLTEQRPRAQSRAMVVPLRQGDAVVFAVNQRPVRGQRGNYRVRMRHGVSTVRAGRRHVLGAIFHDAE